MGEIQMKPTESQIEAFETYVEEIGGLNEQLMSDIESYIDEVEETAKEFFSHMTGKGSVDFDGHESEEEAVAQIKFKDKVVEIYKALKKLEY